MAKHYKRAKDRQRRGIIFALLFLAVAVAVYAAALSKTAVPLETVDFSQKLCFVVGSEANGISKEVLDACQRQVIIGMEKSTESLNAATAASILMYEQYRSQR